MPIKIIKKSGEVLEPAKKACKTCKHWQRDVDHPKHPTLHNCPRFHCLMPPDSFCSMHTLIESPE